MANILPPLPLFLSLSTPIHSVPFQQHPHCWFTHPIKGMLSADQAFSRTLSYHHSYHFPLFHRPSFCIQSYHHLRYIGCGPPFPVASLILIQKLHALCTRTQTLSNASSYNSQLNIYKTHTICTYSCHSCLSSYEVEQFTLLSLFQYLFYSLFHSLTNISFIFISHTIFFRLCF